VSSGRRSQAGGAGKAGRRQAAGNSGGGLWEQVSTLIIAIAIALAIRAFVIEPFRIPSGSMLPTLLIGDHLFVNKFIYGIKIPLMDYRLPGLRGPERGDVVVFTVAKDGPETFPADQRQDLPREEFVKRIIGLPGDRIVIRNSVVSVNGEIIDTRRLEETFEDERGQKLEVLEVRTDARTFRILEDARVSFPDPTPRTVPPGRYFMLGDNRDHSKDSRIWGTVRLAEIKGPAYRLYWSWDFNGTWAELLNPVTWFDLLTRKMRWERIGDRIQ
jgi:signal peptidase I